ncbi:MAG: transglutaminase family protein [Rhodospirillaceae bacterium]|jgi:transglutaminase-like putative cysteine protease|nr:transglutaminase family protein [Rhodospirillaceae bacterium]
MSDDPSTYLEPGPTVESGHPDIVAFAQRVAGGAGTQMEKAIGLYYAVRDEIRYNPYISAIEVEAFRATKTLAEKQGYCVAKAILLAAACRAQGVPARLGFADVRNHLSTEKMRQRMKTDLFYWHGYTAIYLDGKWVKATPAFNIELCEKFGLKPLEFDGREDSIYHPIDVSGSRHMEYLNYRGEFAEPPLAQIHETFIREYPHWRDRTAEPIGDFEAEVAAETGTP